MSRPAPPRRPLGPVPAVIVAALLGAPAGAQPPALVVSVAASLADVMSELARRHEQATGQTVRLNVGGSNHLARQIVEGAGADLFVSADDAQMDVVERAGRLVPGSRVALLTNRLVVVGRPGGRLRTGDAAALASPSVRRLALGNPDSVPAGVYARRWLEGQGAWTAIAPRVVPTVTVRAALAAARAGRVEAAVVYATDAATEPTLPVLYQVPAADAPDIVYPAAVVAGPRQDAAGRFLAYLRSAEAGAVFTTAGFGVAGR
ncbi:MAG: molybdate ABC transporter substrate-binding protein [Vicinamibacterales bacterium]